MKKSILNKTNYFILIVLAFVINNVSTVSAQPKDNNLTLTSAERNEAETAAIQFALRFSQTKDITPLLPELYSKDVIELYKNKTLSGIDANTKTVFLSSGLDADPKILKQLDANDWKNLYVSLNNFDLSMFGVLVKASLTGKEPDMDKIFSTRLKELFNSNEYLSNAMDKEEGAKPINSVDALRKTIDTLNQATKIFNEDNEFSFTEKELRVFLDEFYKRKELKVDVEFSDAEYPSLPNKTRVINIVSPILYSLSLAKENGNLKIISTIPYVE